MEAARALIMLSQRCLDAAKHYKRAAEHADQEWLERFFTAQSARQEQMAADLAARIVALGAQAPHRGTIGGELEALALALESNLGLGDRGLVEWCRREAASEEADFSRALEGNDDPACRALLQRGLDEARAALAEFDRLHAAYNRA
jgi:uncharacterized protein (TIGR02284 family)